MTRNKSVPQEVLDKINAYLKAPKKHEQCEADVRVISDVDEYERTLDYNAVEIESRGFDARLIRYKLAGDALRKRQFLDELKQFVDNNSQPPRE